jgi:hypothetical protein
VTELWSYKDGCDLAGNQVDVCILHCVCCDTDSYSVRLWMRRAENMHDISSVARIKLTCRRRCLRM